MSGVLFPLLVTLILIAAALRDDFALSLVYLLVGVFAVGAWWSRRALAQVVHERSAETHAFLGEKVKVGLRIHNAGWLPVAWLDVRDSLPVALASPAVFRRVTTLSARGQASFEYELEARKRGYYPLGPLFLSSGDLLGLGDALTRQGDVQHLTVYPRIVAFGRVSMPASAPQGVLRHSQPIFEDPARVFGKRDYVAGDSLRRVDWKSSAAVGRLQVRLFEPSMSQEVLIVLDMDGDHYHYHSRIDATELGVVIAASFANWIIENKQACGLLVRGRDPLGVNGLPQPVPPRKDKAHLMRLLETLARVEMTQGGPPLPLQIQHVRTGLAWGTTLLVITGQADDALLHELYQARRAGQHAVLILSGPGAPVAEVRHKAGFYGIVVRSVYSERDLEQWRR